MRDALVRAGDAVVDDVAGEAMDAWNARRLQTFEDAEQGLCFGRIDVETVGDPTYVGRRWVHDEGGAPVVVNWQAPAARPFYTATPAEPHGVTLRRRFRTQGRTLLDVSDEALDGSIADAMLSVDDFLLEELERAREARMRDIVATIQADQYGLIARDPSTAAGRAGRSRHRQDGRRAAPGLVPAVQPPRGAAARPPRRAQPDVHGLRVARASRARRGERGATRRRRARRRRRGEPRRPAGGCSG